MIVVSRLFFLRNQVRFVRTWSSPYMARLGVVAAYVRTGSLYTSGEVNTPDFVPKSVCQGCFSPVGSVKRPKCKHFEVATGVWNPLRRVYARTQEKWQKFHYIGDVLSWGSVVYSA